MTILIEIEDNFFGDIGVGPSGPILEIFYVAGEKFNNLSKDGS